LFKTVQDLCAVILIIACIILIVLGIDGEVKGLLALAAGWVFGKGTTNLIAARKATTTTTTTETRKGV